MIIATTETTLMGPVAVQDVKIQLERGMEYPAIPKSQVVMLKVVLGPPHPRLMGTRIKLKGQRTLRKTDSTMSPILPVSQSPVWHWKCISMIHFIPLVLV
jgi:hypothetical protein